MWNLLCFQQVMFWNFLSHFVRQGSGECPSPIWRLRWLAAWSFYCCWSPPPPPQLPSAAKCCPEACGEPRSVTLRFSTNSVFVFALVIPSLKTIPEKWEVKSSGWEKWDISKFCQEQQGWKIFGKTEELATLTPFSFLGFPVNCSATVPKVLFLQVEKQLGQRHLLSNSNILSQALEQPAPASEAFSYQIPEGPLDLNQMTACKVLGVKN